MAEELSEDWVGFMGGHAFDDQWQESIRLAAGYLSIAGKNRADRFVKLLTRMGQTHEQRTHALALAGEALSDMQPDRREAVTVKELAVEMLLYFGTNPPMAPTRLRYRLGLALGEIGDPRFIVVPSALKPEIKVILPDMIEIPPGPFQMGTSDEYEKLLIEQKAQSYGDEKPAHPVFLSKFSIARFPVTNVEFKLFMEQGGYDPQAPWWSTDGRHWRTGEWDSDLSWLPDDKDLRRRYREWLDRRSVEKRDRPYFWDEPRWKVNNLPVVGVSWFEAEAYANWLSHITGDSYRLPNEAEWEKAARGEKGSLWPWGNQWDAEKCNNNESEGKINGTSPVGVYPHGESSYHMQEMIGNVWEWCADWYQDDLYQAQSGQEVRDPCGPETGSARVVRGGSWVNYRNDARCAFRYRLEPDYFNDSVGFRLVLSPSSISAL